MKSRPALLFTGSVIIVVVIVAGFLFITTPRCDDKNCVANVNKFKITTDDLNKEVALIKKVYASQGHNIQNFPSLTSETREALIEKAIITQFAESKKITVSDKELENRFKLMVVKKLQNTENLAKYNEIEEQKFLSILSKETNLDKEIYLQRLRHEMLKDKVRLEINQPFAQWLSDQKNKNSVVRNTL